MDINADDFEQEYYVRIFNKGSCWYNCWLKIYQSVCSSLTSFYG